MYKPALLAKQAAAASELDKKWLTIRRGAPKRTGFALAVTARLARHRFGMTRVAPQRWDDAGQRLCSSSDAMALFAPELARLSSEELRVAHLDSDGWLLGVTAGSGGDSLGIDLPIRDILRAAIALGARALVLAHNHPSGDPTPSPADKAATRRLADVARGLDIRLLDHLIFADRRCRSFRQMGLL
jgi:DNA repair protein RadC